MVTTLRLFCIIAVFISPSLVSAADYPYKKVEDFRTLESFKSIAEFEESIDQYTQHCLDNTGGGTGGIPCFIGYHLWDRELNTYYNRLMKVLGEKERKLLKESQFAWIKEREKTIDFNSVLLDKEYTTTGTMDALMRAGDADRIITPIVKQRVLLLKKWLEFIGDEKHRDKGVHNQSFQPTGNIRGQCPLRLLPYAIHYRQAAKFFVILTLLWK